MKQPCLTNEQKASFAKAALQSFHKPLCPSFDENLAIKDLVAELDEKLDLNDPDVLRKRREFFQIPGARDEDYAQRVMTL